MKKWLVEYEKFGNLMIDHKLYLDRRMTFRRICRLFGFNHAVLDFTIMGELGMTARDLIKSLRKSDEKHISDKYKIKGFRL